MLTFAERKDATEQRRNAHFVAMQDVAKQRNDLNQQLADMQVALTKIDGELELLDRLIAEEGQ